MKTEETILNYMDGTLSEDESGELLHQLSVSPEKRVVLEQHIKLRELTAIAQKPTAVPQFLEANMAERFPAIAAYNREIAGGAMLIEQAARPSYIGRMAASVAAFFAQYPVRTGFAVAAASVIGYFVLHNLSVVDRGSSIVGENKIASVPSTDNNTSQNGNSVLNNASTSINGKVTVPNITSTSSSTNSSMKYSHSGTDFSPSAKVLERTKVRFTEHSQHAPSATSNINNADIPKEQMPAANVKMTDAHSNEANIPVEKKKSDIPVADNSVKDNGAHDIASITTVSDIRAQGIALSDNNVHGSRNEQNPFKDREEVSSGIPFAVRLYGNLGSSFVNVHQNDPTIANRTEGPALLGVDYILDPYVSVGVEFGNAAISQLITQSGIQSSVNGLPSISHVVVSNVVTSGSEYYGRVVGHYTFNPFDLIHIEGTLGVGMSFASSTALLATAALYAGIDLSAQTSFFGGIAFAGARTSANSQNAVVQAVATGNDPIGYVTTNHATGTLFTPSCALRAGFKFKL